MWYCDLQPLSKVCMINRRISHPYPIFKVKHPRISWIFSIKASRTIENHYLGWTKMRWAMVNSRSNSLTRKQKAFVPLFQFEMTQNPSTNCVYFSLSFFGCIRFFTFSFTTTITVHHHPSIHSPSSRNSVGHPFHHRSLLGVVAKSEASWVRSGTSTPQGEERLVQKGWMDDVA